MKEELKKFQWLVAQFLCYYNEQHEKLIRSDIFIKYLYNNTELHETPIDIKYLIQNKSLFNLSNCLDDEMKEMFESKNYTVCSITYDECTISSLTNQSIQNFEVFNNLLNRFIYDTYKLYTDDILDGITYDLFKFLNAADMERLEDGYLYKDLSILDYNLYKLSNTDKRYYKYLNNHPTDLQNNLSLCVRDFSAYYFSSFKCCDTQKIYFIIPT